MTKKNTFFIFFTILLLFLIFYLFDQNSSLKKEISLQKKENTAELKKLDEYDSITFYLKNMLSNFTEEINDSFSGFELTKELATELNLKAKNQENENSDNNQFNLNNSNKGFESLKNSNDSISSLLKTVKVTKDSLAYKLKIAHDLLKAKDGKKDTISIKNSKNIEIFYFGELENKSANGFGVGFYKGKGFYIGNWSNNLREGTGKHNYINGDVYVGNFIKDKREGFGVYYYETGDKYKGEWKNDLMNGEGTIILKNGTKKEGFWVDGKMEKK